MKKVLTIAGSDTSGGAGIQADLKTMSALGVYGMSVITAVTAQNTQAVYDVEDISREMVGKQIEVIYEDIAVDAVKIGMVSNAEIIRTIRAHLVKYQAKNIVVDPVMISSSGYHLLPKEAVTALKELMSIADIVTPNIFEAEILSEIRIDSEEDMKTAAKKISKLGPSSVLVKGGHNKDNANDVLFNGDVFTVFPANRIVTKNTHGTGCTLSSAIASYLAKGLELGVAVRLAKDYITEAINNSFSIGKGVGPLGHFIGLYQRGDISYE